MDSILNTTKVTLGLPVDYTPFDQMIITYINLAFSNLQQLGVGPSDGFSIEDETSKWEDFTLPAQEVPQLSMIKAYLYAKVRMLFDPPTTSFLLEALNKAVQEFEWRMNVRREETEWVDPFVGGA